MDKAVVITGISGGIGQAIFRAVKLAKFKVIGIDVVEPEIRPDLFLKFDLSRIDDQKYVKKLEDFFRASSANLEIYSLVNNAAIQIVGDFESLQLEDLSRSLNVNVKAPFLLSKLLYQYLVKANGRIVNIGSIHADLTKKNFLPYSVSKTSLRGLTKSLAIEIGSKVRVNSIEPAAVNTELLASGFLNFDNEVDNLIESHPTSSIGDPDEIAGLVKYLIVDAPYFLNGSSIKIDGAISSVLHERR